MASRFEVFSSSKVTVTSSQFFIDICKVLLKGFLQLCHFFHQVFHSIMSIKNKM